MPTKPPTVIGRNISWTIFRYIVADALFSFLVAFLFFFFIFFVNQLLLLAQEILTKKVPFFQVALLVVYSLPSIIAMSAPFACLVGTLMTIGRLSSDNEVLVMMSSGLSYRNIFVPALAVGIVISMLSFFTNDVLLPAGTVQFSRLYRQILVSTPALELEANSVKRFRDTVIVTGPVTGRAIDNVLILDRTSDGERRVIMAKNAELKDAGKEGLSLDLNEAFIQSSKEIMRDDYDYASSGFLRYWVPQEDLIQAVSSIGPREMSSVDVRREIGVKNADLRERLDDRYGKALIQGLSLEDSLRKGPSNDAWNRRENYFTAYTREFQAARAIENDRSLLIYRLEYYKKFSIPFGAFSFVFLAVPLGLLAKKSGQTVGFIFGLIIAVIYWALLLGGQTMGVRLGYSPFWSMWLPNMLAGGIGLCMCIVRLRK
ncbi:LptF/LptG family permease [Leadbettera azotonutricia]|uniref:Putative permease, YjgP/YjgQ family n=1 Tax=Leadbettera azotonutricia (strain ATCC BAA-888 / DSM 13862 / ZAS-9) TaxID=545695 RepID=F5YBN7_LEAAZ|nr:LptF/LptG family permease [Leadbettera azotonutricia]AEF82576.1 putative permease, YjgP/YjgQ family [Leadbettera azotonutricia ZAS-9]